jgi:hypothetical protein
LGSTGSTGINASAVGPGTPVIGGVFSKNVFHGDGAWHPRSLPQNRNCAPNLCDVPVRGNTVHNKVPA